MTYNRSRQKEKREQRHASPFGKLGGSPKKSLLLSPVDGILEARG